MDLHRKLLDLLSRTADHADFEWVGGSALAERYLHHRRSFDVDFFTSQEGLVVPFSHAVEQGARREGLEVAVVRRLATLVEMVFRQPATGESIRLDLAYDSPHHFEPAVLTEHGVYVRSYQDLTADKVLAFYGRAEPRDAVDLFFILRREPFDRLAERAAKKDPGFDLYRFALALRKVESFPNESERWPVTMHVPFVATELKAQFRTLSAEIMARLKPATSPPGEAT
jgi:predicted nucleotidyltransferase component of viral defense system